MNELLKVNNLKTYFFTYEGTVKAVDNISFSMKKGETLSIVGESGSGKSVTALSIMRLIPTPPGKILGGEIIFDGINLLNLTEAEMIKVRGKKISMIFQEPMTSLDPVFTVGHEIIEALILHQNIDKKSARNKAIELLKLVGIPDAEKRIDSYPHEMSGGMRQRVMIAMALSCNPSLLIADEPTTALDVTIQAQILRLMKDLTKKLDTSLILITHDLGVVAEMADNVAVMYAGHIVEYASVIELFEDPSHPYTSGLSKAIPRLDAESEYLETIEGTVPNLAQLPSGCPFHPRCKYKKEICEKELPELRKIKENHWVSCHLYNK